VGIAGGIYDEANFLICDDHVRAGFRPQFLVAYSGRARLLLIFATKALIFMFKKAAPIASHIGRIKKMRSGTIVLALSSFVGVAGVALANDLVRFPEGYRNWYVDHSTVALQGHTPENEVGIQQVYANALALKGLETGKFEDGATFAVDHFQYVEDNNKTLTQGNREVIAVMQRD
jgi:hypothetical protein